MKKYFSLLLMSLSLLGGISDIINNTSVCQQSKKKYSKKKKYKYSKKKQYSKKYKKQRKARRRLLSSKKGKTPSFSSLSSSSKESKNLSQEKVAAILAPKEESKESSTDNQSYGFLGRDFNSAPVQKEKQKIKNSFSKKDIETLMSTLIHQIHYNEGAEVYPELLKKGLLDLTTRVNMYMGEVFFGTSVLKPLDENSPELKQVKEAIAQNYSTIDEFYSEFADHILNNQQKYKSKLLCSYKPMDSYTLDRLKDGLNHPSSFDIRAFNILPTKNQLKNRLMGLLKWIITKENFNTNQEDVYESVR